MGPPPPGQCAVRHQPLTDVRQRTGVAISLSLLAALLFVVAGIAVLVHAAWWAPVAIAAAAISALLILLTFSPWLLAGLAIDVIVFVVALRARR